MSLLIKELSVWDISFRWAGYDPDSFWLRYPLEVKDNFRLLMSAILHGEIICNTLCLDKLPSNSKADPAFYIRSYEKQINDCLSGKRFDAKFLKWASLGRLDFLEWCERRGIPSPQFWFPAGWKLDFEVPNGGFPGHRMRHVEPGNGELASFSFHWRDDEEEEDFDGDESETNENNSPKLRPNQATKITCQTIAQNIWKTEAEVSIAAMARRHEIQILGGAKPYVHEVIRRWLSEVAPPEVSARVGRPSSKNTTEDI